MAMSRIRQAVSPTDFEARTALPDEKVSTRYPSNFNRSGNDSRTDSSSSTIANNGRLVIGRSLRGASGPFEPHVPPSRRQETPPARVGSQKRTSPQAQCWESPICDPDDGQ